MDRKEFEEKWVTVKVVKQFEGNPRNPVRYVETYSPDSLWQWIEQYGAEQRIDENKSFRKAIIDEAVLIDDEGKDVSPDPDSAYEKGMDDVGRDLLKRIENRIKELKDE